MLLDTGHSRIEVEARGAGDAVVLLPSLGRGARDFDDLVPALAAAGFQTVAVNPRGVAGSRGPMNDLDLHDFAADVAGVIEALDAAPAHLAGHAFGNHVARCLAADRPRLVRSVALLGTLGLVPPPREISVALERCLDLSLPAEERRQDIKAVFFAAGTVPDAWVDGWWPEAAAAQRAARDATPLGDWWDGGSAPLLIIQGLRDSHAPPASGHAMRDGLGDRVRLVELPNAGHALLPEQPEAIAKALIDFLRSV